MCVCVCDYLRRPRWTRKKRREWQHWKSETTGNDSPDWSDCFGQRFPTTVLRHISVRQAIQFHFIGLNAAIHLLPITSTRRWRPETINWQISTWPTTTTSCSWSWELTSWIHCSHYGLPTRSRTTRAADRRSTGGRGTTAAPTVNTHREEKIQLIISNTLLNHSDTYTDKLFQIYNNDNTHNTFSGLVALPWRLKN